MLTIISISYRYYMYSLTILKRMVNTDIAYRYIYLPDSYILQIAISMPSPVDKSVDKINA